MLDLVGDNHLLAGSNETYELELLSLAGARPAVLEVTVTVEPDVERAREREVVGQDPVDRRAVS